MERFKIKKSKTPRQSKTAKLSKLYFVVTREIIREYYNYLPIET